MIIINADDFGRDTNVNHAIIRCFKAGLCSSATLMPNMPGFEEACELVHQNRLVNHVGIHLTLRDGYPLTEPIRKLNKFCDSYGRLSVLTVRPMLFLMNEEKAALAQEIRAQIGRCRKFGISLTHLDSHKHQHTNLAIARVLIPVAVEHGLFHIRIARNCGPGIGKAKRLYKTIFNSWLRRKNLARTKYFGSIEDYLCLTQHGPIPSRDPVELMIHPILNDGNLVIDRDTRHGFDEVAKEVASYGQAVSFSGHKYA